MTMDRRPDGQIIQRGDKWVARMEWRDAQGRKQSHSKTFDTQKSAKQYLRELTTQRGNGGWTEPQRQTLNDYLDTWQESALKNRVTPRTFNSYIQTLADYIRPALGGTKLSKLTAAQIQQTYAAMMERGLSARTVRYSHAILHSALKQAVKWGVLAQNPSDLVDLPKQPRKEMRALSPEEARKFLETALTDEWSTLFTLAVDSGLRPSEVLAVQWKDLDLATGVLTVQRTLVRDDHKWYFKEPKTQRSRRSIPLGPTTVKALRQVKAEQAETRIRLGQAYTNYDLVFASETGTPLFLRNLERRHFKPILQAAHLPTIRLYDLRHTCATLLLAQGVNPKIVSERLGHASVTLTLDTYSHILPDMQKEASSKLESILFG